MVKLFLTEKTKIKNFACLSHQELKNLTAYGWSKTILIVREIWRQIVIAKILCLGRSWLE